MIKHDRFKRISAGDAAHQLGITVGQFKIIARDERLGYITVGKSPAAYYLQSDIDRLKARYTVAGLLNHIEDLRRKK